MAELLTHNKSIYVAGIFADSQATVAIATQTNDNDTTGFILTNVDSEPIIVAHNGGNIGFGCSPLAKYYFSLEDDTNPAFVSGWDERHAAFAYTAGGVNAGIGISYSSSESAVYMSYLRPGIAWLDAKLQLNSFSLYSSGSTLSFSLDSAGNIALGAQEFGSGQGVFSIQNATVAPSTNPSGSSILYCENSGAGSRLCVRNEAGDTIRFYKEPVLTSAISTITHASPGTADYDTHLTNSGGYGFTTQDQGYTVLAAISNLQTRVNELEAKLQNFGMLA